MACAGDEQAAQSVQKPPGAARRQAREHAGGGRARRDGAEAPEAPLHPRPYRLTSCALPAQETSKQHRAYRNLLVRHGDKPASMLAEDARAGMGPKPLKRPFIRGPTA